jgi:hypothetical protein
MHASAVPTPRVSFPSVPCSMSLYVPAVCLTATVGFLNEILRLSLADEVIASCIGMKDAVMRLCFRKAREECGLVTVPLIVIVH